jgi:hypothetical protein
LAPGQTLRQQFSAGNGSRVRVGGAMLVKQMDIFSKRRYWRNGLCAGLLS